MAAKVGASFSSYRAYEAGQRPMRGDHLGRLVELGFDANWLLAGLGQMQFVPSVERPNVVAAQQNVPVVATEGPGFNMVEDVDGARWERIDMVPEVMAPALKWIASEARPECDESWWVRAASAMIARYEFEFFTWFNSGKGRKM